VSAASSRTDLSVAASFMLSAIVMPWQKLSAKEDKLDSGRREGARLIA
jgi:hypothetical protein